MSAPYNKINLDTEYVAAQYESGMTIAEIAKEGGVSVQPIKRALKEQGVKTRKAAPRPGVLSGKLHPKWKGGRRKRKDGYIIVWTEQGHRLEHRVVMEKIIGRPLRDDEVVHHKDGNPSNNDPSNLEIKTLSEHSVLHREETRKILLMNGMKKCTLCFVVKPISEFYKTKYNRMGIQSWCKPCKNSKDSERRRRKKK